MDDGFGCDGARDSPGGMEHDSSVLDALPWDPRPMRDHYRCHVHVVADINGQQLRDRIGGPRRHTDRTPRGSGPHP